MADRRWNLAVFTQAELGRRNRRTIDAVLLAVGTVVTGAAAVLTRSAPGQDLAVGRAVGTVLGWAGALWRTAFVCALILALAIVLAALLRGRWDLVRDLVSAVAVVAGVGLLLGVAVEHHRLAVEPHVLSRWGFPELRIAAVVSVLAVAGPELVRPVRLLAVWVLAFGAVGAVALGVALPSAALASVALGLGAGTTVRLVFGTAAGFPPAERVRLALASLGVAARELHASARQRIGAASYVGFDADGEPLHVRALGRDAQDTQRTARRWRQLAYRDPPRSVAVGRLEQVEHEALATLLAEQAGVAVPGIVTAALGPEGDALVVTRQPDLEPLEVSPPEHVADETLDRLWAEIAALHAAGISHGRLNLSNVVVADDAPLLVDFSAATLGAPQSALDIDVAELLVACTVLVGPDRVLRAAVGGVGADAIAGALPYLQRAALTPHVRDLARHNEVALKDLRAAAAAATGRAVPEIVPLRRIRPQNILLTGLLIVAAYLLITQLARIGFGTIADELRTADLAWAALALVLAQATFVGSGIALRGTVQTPLPLLPCVVLQSAIKFINLSVPSSAGRIGMNIRFLQRMGVPAAPAVAAGAVDDVSERIVQMALVLVVVPFVHVNLNGGQLHLKAPDARLVAAVVLVIVASACVFLGVPRLRSRVVPPLSSALAGLWTVARSRRKRLELFGGRLGAELLYALALGATCHAYGVGLSLPQLILVNTTASALSGLIPVPGGIGAAEATLSAVLIALGVDKPTAFAIALTQRLCTFYLPPIWGYVAFRWLRRRDYL